MKTKKLKKIMVTGGAGFIGSNFIRHVVKERHDAQIVNVDLLTYAGNRDNLVDVATNFQDRYTFIKADIANRKAMNEIFNEHAPDTVVNFAAETHVDRSIMSSEAFIKTNICGTQVLLDTVRERPETRMVQISTDEVYGSLGETASFKETDTLKPRNPYSASKACADLLAQAYCTTYGIDLVITRSSNNYGPYQFPEKFIPLAITNALEDKPIPVYGTGGNIRDWIFVEDNCAGILLAAEHGEPSRVYHFGGMCEMKNIDLARAILRNLGKGDNLIKLVADRPGHDWRYSLDISETTKALGWKPTTSLEDGLNSTIEWYRAVRSTKK
jgi:dTDP-glucose 4,6-dehydratase